MLTLAIDPGMTGAIAILDESGNVELLADLPIIQDKSLCFVDGDLLRTAILQVQIGRITKAYVERVSAMPRQGVSSMFKFGTVTGSIIGCLRCMQIPVEFVTPASWKRAYALGDDKDAALHKARFLFPNEELHLKKHHNRAEALLIANYFLKGA